MPDPPSVGLFTRFVLEDPLVPAAGLAIAAVALLFLGFREGRRGAVHLGLAAGAAAAALLIVDRLVETAGEAATEVTRAFVGAVAAGDVPQATGLLAPDLRLSVASPNNPGYGIAEVTDLLRRAADRYPIESNDITMLDAYTESESLATVHLACWTDVDGGWGPTPSQWVLQIRREADGSWRVTRMTCISVARRTPQDLRWLR